MPKVKFVPQNVEFEIGTTESVLLLAQKNDIHIQSVCKGIPSCAECKVKIVQGEHHVIPPSYKELDLIGTAHYIDHSRLSCQLKCFGDVVVDLSEQLEKENRVVKKARGPQKKDPKESHAVLGNIIEEYKEDDDKQLIAEFKPEMRTDKDGFYEDFKKNKDRIFGSRNDQQNNANYSNKEKSRELNKQALKSDENKRQRDQNHRDRNNRPRRP